MNERQIQAAQVVASRAREQYEAGKKKKEKKTGSLVVWLILIILYVGYQLMDSAGFRRAISQLRIRLLPYLMGLSLKLHLPFNTVLTIARVLGIFLLVLLVVLVAAAVSKKKKKTEAAPASGRVYAAVQRRDPRSASFTKPETYCAVHNHSAEDHLAYDKAQRIAQLDDWLKSGLIDREEYRVLKDRYQRDL